MAVTDVYGHIVPADAPTYVAWIQWFGGSPLPHYAPNPDYSPLALTTQSNPAVTPPSLQFSFDTIGQSIIRAIGHRRTPLRLLWVQGITASGQFLQNLVTLVTNRDMPIGSNTMYFDDASQVKPGAVLTGTAGVVANVQIQGPTGIPANTTVTEVILNRAGDNVIATEVVISTYATADVPSGTVVTFATSPATYTWAAALCAPIDPDEEGGLVGVFDGTDLIFSSETGITPQPNIDALTQILLIKSLAALQFFPGDEIQAPANLIVADKGANATPAFRGIQYVIVPNYPVSLGPPSNLSMVFNRTNPGNVTNIIAVQFAPGAG